MADRSNYTPEQREQERIKTREYMRRWRAENPGEDTRRKRIWREANPGREAANKAAWDAANPNYHREWREKNEARCRELKAAWRAANPETWKASTAAYRKAHPEMFGNEYHRAWRAANPHKIGEYSARRRARLANAPVVEKIDRPAIIARDKGVCHLCGKKVAKKQITLDHLIPISLGGEHTAANLAVAHRSCNSRKGTRPANEQLMVVGC